MRRKSSVKPAWRVNRRRFLTALGLGGLAAGLPSLGWSSIVNAGDGDPPKRLVLWINAHGSVPNAWNLAMPGAPTDRVATADFGSLSFAETPPILQPLDAYRRHLTLIEGVALSSLMADHIRIAQHSDWDPNEHTLANAHLLCATETHQEGGINCRGGGKSIDQEIGDRTRVGSRWASRVYGTIHAGAYSHVSDGVASPRVEDPALAFADLMGLYSPTTDPTGREDLLRWGRGSVLDLVADEYDFASRRLGTEGRRKLALHAELVRQTEQRFTSTTLLPECRLDAPNMADHLVDQWNHIIAMALACDMTRVITCSLPIISPSDFGWPADPDIHGGYAHSSVDDMNEPFQARAEAGMIMYNQWYAERFARLIGMLDSLPEGTGTVLQHANVVWLSECSTGTHQHVNHPLVIAGGGDGFFRSGSYVRYPRPTPSPWHPWYPIQMGPSFNRFYVTLMRAMGLPDETFAQPAITLEDGSVHEMRGTLAETHT